MSNQKNREIILILLSVLFVLLLMVFCVITFIQGLEETSDDNFVFPVDIGIDVNKPNPNRTVKEIIEDAGSIYLDRTGNLIPRIYVEFRYDLYDENGESKQKYFEDLVEELITVIDKNFYLVDESKKIEIYVIYSSTEGTYKIMINNIKDFYEKTEGEDYVNVENSKIVKQSDFIVTNTRMILLASRNMYYANTEFVDENKVQLENGYYSYDNGAVYAKLLGGRVINTVFTKKYKEEIAMQTKVGTTLSEVNENFSNLAFGSVKDGYLGYRTLSYYVFLYDDQISFYEYTYEPNNYFDKYLSDYCETGDLQQLYEDFTEGWTNCFEKEYDPEIGRLKLTFPTRGIDIDIENNDSRGIKIYSNYYLTDTVKELIKSHKITLESNKDLIHLTEIARYETMR